jgi:uncharacterized protein YdhG (YjbR/CyaY superfamily)
VKRAPSRPKAGTGTVPKYLARLDPDKRSALERVRRIIRAAAPRAEEHISHHLPAYRLDGRSLIWFGAAAGHCALYGIPGGFERELARFDTSGRGTVRFRPDAPLPAALVRKIVEARVAHIAAARRR